MDQAQPKIQVKTIPVTGSQSTNQATPQAVKPPLVKHMNQPQSRPNLIPTIIGAVLIIAAGTLTGYGLSRLKGGGAAGLKSSTEVSSAGVKVGDIVGNPDEKTFRDKAEGVLARGGIDGEGSHHILRPGGVSQNVYVTSSVVDLDQFVDHKVKVWGETFAAQKAGWLMDVGRVQILELNAEKPFEEEE